MKRIILFLAFILPVYAFAQLNGATILSGRILNDKKESVPNASVTVKGTKNGTLTDTTGKFSLVTNQKPPFTLVVTSVGFAPYELYVKNENKLVAIQLQSQSYLADEVVVTASRKEEKLLRSPVAIEKLSLRALKETPAASFYDAIGNAKGVQLTTSSITFKVPNTRGFNIPNNFRFMQLVDGVDMQAATLGVPLGNAIGPSELDIQSIEITPGAASALYGMNAITGLSNLITKDPWNNQGLSIFLRGGINHVDNIDHAAAPLGEFAIRYAKAFKNKFAFKVNLSYLTATDWRSDTRLDQNPNELKSANGTANGGARYTSLDGAANVAYDGWNKYGDDALAGSNLVSIGG
ncbi:MAG: carboxypeptidase-like regulatory domain-containing protein, partial [Sphingobacteriales bacterium]|nr:carboxypeptidase-like regulatory domain-containing protein [Sphingobacteriales bacterium]